MPQLPLFFYDGPIEANTTIGLDSDTSKHIWQVLRMDAGERVLLTDGKGGCAEGSLDTTERHQCKVFIYKVSHIARSGRILHLGVCLTKNNSRNEWLLEKATELGVASIIPIASTRSEKIFIRDERWQKILQSALLQSRQYHLPQFTPVTKLADILKQHTGTGTRLIAHCNEDSERRPLHKMLNDGSETLILIGPEGDFTADEVNLCKTHGYHAVSLGQQRLRTETAAIAAAAFFNVMNDHV
jgi:16S rRNA (uracil1498-N3)-methyltransferase